MRVEIKKDPRELGRELAGLAGPMVLSNLAYTLLGIVDTLFMGRVSTEAVGSIGVASTLYLAFSLLFRGVVQGTLPYVARMVGSGRPREGGMYLQHFVLLALLASPLVALLPWGVRAYFAVLKPHPEVEDLASIYVNIRFVELPFSLLNAAVGGFLVAVGNARAIMWMAWLSTAVNVAANWVLVFGKLGFPAMGVAGAAWGTVVAVFAQLALGVAALVRGYWREYYLGQWHRPAWRDLVEMVKVGMPLGITDAVELAAFSTFFTLISRLGTVELAASQIANQVSSFAFMPGFALAQATGSLVGRYLGAGEPETAETAGYFGVALGVATMGLVGISFWCLAPVLGRLFTTDQEVLRMTALLLRVMAFYQVFDAANIVFRGALNGAGDTRFTMAAAVGAAVLVFIPAVYLLAFTLRLRLIGAWLGCIAYLITLAVVCFARFRRGSWKYIRLGAGE